jgi:rhamnopyranosyl-N-acetylglucosaminyl-diphospho-decaprenol beta-1,3/1,4-galactofuranosyltransferase
MGNRQKLAVVLVTYNRAADLRTTLMQLSTMQNEFDHLIVINNCSTDNTLAVLHDLRSSFSINFDVHTLDQNRGGAGGFHAGVKLAVSLPVDWIWMSDDDAIPQADCFTTLLMHASSENNIYGSTAVVKNSSDGELCWPAFPQVESKRKAPQTVLRRDKLDAVQQVSMLPFLGFMVSRRKALEVGPPNSHYFISGDDVEYGIRMRAAGAKLFQVRDSVVMHPRILRYHARFLWRQISCLRMDAWRRYFDVRNRIWNSRLRTGYPGALATALAMLLRLVFTLVYEQNRGRQTSAYFRGIRDGLFDFQKSNNRSAILGKPSRPVH